MLAQPSCTDETQLELAARWGHLSNNPSLPFTLRSPKSAEPGAGLLTPVLRACVTKPSCHQGWTRTEGGTNTSTGHPAGIFQSTMKLNNSATPWAPGRVSADQTRAGKGTGWTHQTKRSSIHHLSYVCIFPAALGSVSP